MKRWLWGAVWGAVWALVAVSPLLYSDASAAPPDNTHRLTLALEANTRAVGRLERALGRCRCP